MIVLFLLKPHFHIYRTSTKNDWFESNDTIRRVNFQTSSELRLIVYEAESCSDRLLVSVIKCMCHATIFEITQKQEKKERKVRRTIQEKT